MNPHALAGTRPSTLASGFEPFESVRVCADQASNGGLKVRARTTLSGLVPDKRVRDLLEIGAGATFGPAGP